MLDQYGPWSEKVSQGNKHRASASTLYLCTNATLYKKAYDKRIAVIIVSQQHLLLFCSLSTEMICGLQELQEIMFWFWTSLWLITENWNMSYDKDTAAKSLMVCVVIVVLSNATVSPDLLCLMCLMDWLDLGGRSVGAPVAPVVTVPIVSVRLHYVLLASVSCVAVHRQRQKKKIN